MKMFKRVQHIIVLVLLWLSSGQANAQMAMPDTVCVGTTRLYRVNDPSVPSTYTWKIDGVTQTVIRNEISITWNTAGVFQLTVQEHSNNGCDGDIRSGVVHVNPPPVPDAGPDAIVCFGTTFRLSGSGGTLYQWSPATYLSDPGISNPVASIPFAGTYKYVLNVSGNGCRSQVSDTVVITLLPPVKVFAGKDTTAVLNQPLQLNAVDISNSGFINYTWSPSFGLNNSLIKNPVAVLDRDITYFVTARTADGCAATDDIKIRVFKGPDIYVPTGFTPNGDGLNDIFKPVYAGIRELKYFSVYSRWGELVFTTSSQSAGWNGIFKGQQQDGNVFVWNVEGIDFRGNVVRKKGTVVLIR
jgi:gliding motility-associated-like protein